MHRKRLLWQLFPSYLLVTLLALLAVTWYASTAARRFFYERAAGELESRGRVVAKFIVARELPEDAKEAELLCREIGQASGTRLTLIQPSGKVLADSEHDPETMENHADRREVIDALAGKVGRHIRSSPTLGVPMMYVAVSGHDQRGNSLVVRTAMSLSHVDLMVRSTRMRIALAGVGIALLAAFVSLLVSRRIASPIEEMKRGVERLAGGELSHRLYVPASDEAANLATAINEMAAELQDRIRAITAQRNEQEAVFASMVEGVLAIDAQGRILRMNRAAGKLLGIEPDAAQGRNVAEVARNVELQAFIEQTLSGAAPTEGEMLFRSGGEKWLQIHGTILNDAAGCRMGAVVVLNDLTRIRRLENFRRDFVANVSHELKTPITSIKGFVETLLDGAMREPESAEKFLGIIARQADRLNAIINDLLLLSKLEQGDKAAISTEEAAIRPVLDAAVQLCAPRAEAKNIGVEVHCDDSLRSRINVPLLEQAVVNLVDNAVKYSDDWKTVSVKAAARDGVLELSVCDEGYGIAAEHLERIFERFYRVDKGRSREMGGTGLGLAIVKHIAQAHGGTVTVESAPGKGSRFTLFIPSSAPAQPSRP